MEIVRGNMWNELKPVGGADLILFSANGTLNSKRELVMGAGAAKQAKELFPTLPYLLGRRIGQIFPYDYRVALTSKVGTPENDFVVIGALQVKRNWRECANLPLIRDSCKELTEYVDVYRRVVMNYPGCGLGGLTKAQVQPILEEVLGECNNIFIYER